MNAGIVPACTNFAAPTVIIFWVKFPRYFRNCSAKCCKKHLECTPKHSITGSKVQRFEVQGLQQIEVAKRWPRCKRQLTYRTPKSFHFIQYYELPRSTGS